MSIVEAFRIIDDIEDAVMQRGLGNAFRNSIRKLRLELVAEYSNNLNPVTVGMGYPASSFDEKLKKPLIEEVKPPKTESEKQEPKPKESDRILKLRKCLSTSEFIDTIFREWGITSKHLSNVLGVHSATLSNWKNGKSKPHPYSVQGFCYKLKKEFDIPEELSYRFLK